MLPAKPFRYPGTDADIQRLARLLEMGLQSAFWTPPAEPAILNLACGRADETGILLDALAAPAGRAFYLGIDLRPLEIDEARSRWLPGVPPGWEVDFRCGDASRTDRMKLLPSFDFIFVRHQNFWSDVSVWSRIYQNALTLLRPEGMLAITSYFDREHALACACLSQLGAEKAVDVPHFASRPLDDAPNKSVDRHLALWKVPAPGGGGPAPEMVSRLRVFPR